MNRRSYFLEQVPEPGPGAANPPDLMGYPSVEALVQAKRASDAEAMRQNQEIQRMQGMLQAANQRPEIPQRRLNFEEQLDTIGIPLDALDQYIENRASKVIDRAFQPIAKGIQARQTIVGEYPDYNKFEHEVAQFIEGNPSFKQRYQNTFQVDPEAALELAFLKFGESKRRSSPPTEDRTKERRTDASIPGSRTGDSRGAGTDRYEEAKREAKEHYLKTGDPSRLAHAVYSKLVSDDFLNQ